jgi:diaminohydroxyphosphoribosylaminopyrimidine deaminase/5-amino-6-(5-phosphoribosylamino)uracil reductase
VETVFFSEKNLDYKRPLLPQILTELYARKLYSLLVEGGSVLLQSFLEAGLWDEAHVEIAPLTLGQGVKAPDMGNSSIAVLRQRAEAWPDGRRMVHYYATPLA